jgi:hypothetical protein
MTKERASLEATRSRLEAALSRDENWQALKQSRLQAAGEENPSHRLQDARFELLLLSNPLFRAWKHVDEAIEALGRNEPLPERTTASGRPISVPFLPSPNAAKELRSLADLSQGIARLIERGLPQSDRHTAHTGAEAEEPLPAAAPQPSQSAHANTNTDEPAPAAAPQPSEPLLAEDDASREIEAESERLISAAAEAVEPAQSNASRIAPPPPAEPQIVPASARPVADRAKYEPRPLDREYDDREEPPFGFGLDEEEATVTFVTRDPAPSRRSAAPQAHAGVDPTWTPPRGRNEPVPGANLTDTPYALGGEVEEAEVTILKSEDIKERQETAQRDGNLRRFRRALLGD